VAHRLQIRPAVQARVASIIPALLGLALGGCLVGDELDPGDADDLVDPLAFDDTDVGLSSGINGTACAGSPYNCKFRASGGNRVLTNDGSESWGVVTGASVRDGNGVVLATQTGGTLAFNYGQTRLLAGKAHALALTTSNGSAGWYPIDHIKGEASFRAKNGNVDARDPGQGKMACYRVRNSHDASIELKKVVFDSHSTHERAGDYLALPRNNGRRSANLIFSVPGFSLGGATTDHFPAGTPFQRVTVPTASGKPSISIPLWVADGNGAYKRQSGTMRFLYGYVRAADGVRRFGWMAEEALTPSTGCN
jgi:hypothetical protein